MADWHGFSRSNYFAVKDLAGLKRALEPFEIEIDQHATRPDYVSLTPYGEYGGWPHAFLDEDDNEIEFDPATMVCPFMRAGQVFITMEAGAERLRYITGNTSAWAADGRSVSVSLRDIYERVTAELGVAPEHFAEVRYQALPTEPGSLDPATTPRKRKLK